MTNSLCVQIQQKRLVRHYYLHSQALQEVDQTENLSVMLTSDATWEAHINAVTNKASKTGNAHTDSEN